MEPQSRTIKPEDFPRETLVVLIAEYEELIRDLQSDEIKKDLKTMADHKLCTDRLFEAKRDLFRFKGLLARKDAELSAV